MKNQDNKNNLLKNTLRLALPIAMQQLMIASLHLVDTAMVVSLGDVSTAAIGTAGRWFFLFNLCIFGFSSGMSVIVSQFWGIKDKKSIHKAFGLGLLSAVTFAIIFSMTTLIIPKSLINVFSDDINVINEGARYLQIAGLSFIPLSISLITGYLLRSTESVKLPLIISFISISINTLLNYILIFGKWGFEPMGIQGAAYATVISSAIQCVLFIVISYIKKNIAYSKLRELIPKDIAFVKKYFITTLPVLINEILWAVGVNVYNMVLARQGSSNYAAYTIFSSIEQISFTFFIGICSACAVIIGKLVGQKKLDEAYQTAKKYIISTLVMAVVVSTVLFLSAKSIVSLYDTQNPQTADTAVTLLKILCFILPFYLIPYICIVGIFRAGGDTKAGMYIDVFNVWVIGVPVTLICGFLLKLEFKYIFLFMYSEHFFKVIICLIYFKKRKWLRTLT